MLSLPLSKRIRSLFWYFEPRAFYGKAQCNRASLYSSSDGGWITLNPRIFSFLSSRVSLSRIEKFGEIRRWRQASKRFCSSCRRRRVCRRRFTRWWYSTYATALWEDQTKPSESLVLFWALYCPMALLIFATPMPFLTTNHQIRLPFFLHFV